APGEGRPYLRAPREADGRGLGPRSALVALRGPRPDAGVGARGGAVSPCLPKKDVSPRPPGRGRGRLSRVPAAPEIEGSRRSGVARPYVLARGAGHAAPARRRCR